MGSTTSTYGVNAATLHTTSTITDEASKARTLEYDNFGRLAQVTEALAGSPVTTYSYKLGNLSGVAQGAQTRTFEYTSLHRLLSATNPESGLVSFQYYDNGNLKKKIAGEFATTEYTYDGLNRIMTKTYTPGTGGGTLAATATDIVRYCYDGRTVNAAANACEGSRTAPNYGLLTGSGSVVSRTSLWYDALGRVVNSSQRTPASAATPYNFGYSYKLHGEVESVSYPSGNVVSYGFHANGKVKGVGGTRGGSAVQYTSGGNAIGYTPHGALATLKFGNGVDEIWTYNAKLQPEKVTVSTVSATLLALTNCFDTGLAACGQVTGMQTANNGNVQAQIVNGVARVYGYDAANRLTSVNHNGGVWTQSFTYDAWGNRAVSSTGLPAATVEEVTGNPFNANNRVIGWLYDSAGNVVGIPAAGGTTIRASCAAGLAAGTAMMRTSCYDAENRMARSTDASGNTAEYGYDAEGRRVTKKAGSVVTTFVYDAAGHLAAEYGGTVSSSAGVRYVAADHLGSTRLLMKADGTVDASYDYLPFGQELGGIAGGNSVKFTGKERDVETGLDYFGARYFSGAQGRFTSPDEPLLDQHPEDPQSWNLYTYARNNPLRYVDPTGQAVCSYSSGSAPEGGAATDEKACAASGGMWLYQPTDTDDPYADASAFQFSTTVTERTGALDAKGQAVINRLSENADSSMALIGTVAGGSTAAGAGAAAIGLTGLIGEGVISISPQTATVALATGQSSAYVSRWGRTELQAGDWVMNGVGNKWNYFWSGKWQRGMGNEFAPFSSGQTFLVPKSAVQNPGWREQGLGWLKSLLGQRVYRP